MMRRHSVSSARHHGGNADTGVTEIVVGGTPMFLPAERPAGEWEILGGESYDERIHVGFRGLRVQYPAVFGSCQILQSRGRVDAHGCNGSLDALTVLLQVVHRAVRFAHPQHADAAARTGQLAFLDQTVDG